MRRDDATRREAIRRKRARALRPLVERVEPRVLMATFTVTNTTDTAAAGSLRFAIGQSNATPGSNVIDFNIAGTGVQTIAITSALPAITVPVTIDGTSQPGFSSTPLIELDGAGAGAKVDGLDISAGGSTVEGLAINRFTGEGISLSAIGNNAIEQDFLGTDPTGTVAEGNGLDGLLIQVNSDNNTIQANLISGNKVNGIYLNGQLFAANNPVTSGNLVAGNAIGTDVTGTQILGNGGDGIYLQNAPMTTVGGTTAAARNVISGNNNGLELYDNSDASFIEGNYIGTDVTGEVALANTTTGAISGDGIVLRGISNSTIGGTAAGSGNVISGNKDYGIDSFVIGSGTIAIEGNLIGTDALGTKAVGNGNIGINISGETGVTIGGTTAAARNVISGNGGDGILGLFGGPGLTIQGNYIGTDVTGTASIGNGGDGIDATYDGITIGGLGAGAGNVIANNGTTAAFDHSGVRVTGSDTPVLSNSIYNNKLLGIELNGGNNGQAAPVLTSAVSMDATSSVAGTLTAAAGVYTLQFFSTPGLNASGNAEGKTLIGTSTVTVVGTSDSFTLTLPSGFTPGTLITATATDASGNTSQFSAPTSSSGVGPGSMPPTISAQASASSVSVGQQVSDTFTITNGTLVDDTGVAFLDAIPSGTTFVSGTTSTGAAVTLANGTATATLGTLAAGQSVMVTINLIATASAVPAITNVGEVTATNPGVLPGSDTASAMTAVAASANLAVAIVGPTTATQVGQTLTYMVTATDNGPSPATGVTLTDILPNGVTLVSAKASVGTVTTGSGTVVDSVSSIAPGASVVLTITVMTTSASSTSVTDTAKVLGNEPDPDPTNNAATLTNPVTEAADIAITSDTVSPNPTAVGQSVTFTIIVANNGPTAATGIVDATTLPAGLTFVSGMAVGGVVTASNGVVTAPVGTLASGTNSVITIVAMATANGSFVESSTATSSLPDPTSANNTATATLVVTPIADLSVVLSAPVGPVSVGVDLTYTAVVTNNGPSAATNVVFSDTLFPGETFVSVESNQVAGTTSDGAIVTQPIGTLVAGASATVVLVVIPQYPTTVTDTATVAATEPDPVLGNNRATASTIVVIPPTFIAFDSATYSVSEDAGFAAITIDRVGDSLVEAAVHFSTYFGGNATAGVDYTPTQMTVFFPVGATQETVTVPVLPDPYDNHDEMVDLELDSPTVGVMLGTPATAVLTIVDTDPVLVGPRITDIKLTGPANAITAIELDTTGKLNPITANFAPNYTIVALGGGNAHGLAAGTVVPVVAVAYDPTSGAIVIVPAVPLPGDELFLVEVNGTRFGAVSDLAGNTLNSTLSLAPGADFDLTIARGTSLDYLDENGASVNLTLTGPGTLDIDRLITGQVERLEVVGAVTNQTVISGSVHAASHRTTLGSILGLGQFGSIRVNLTTPAFYVTNTVYPNPLSIEDAPAEDTLVVPPPVTVVKASKAKAKVKATTIRHPHATAAHALSVKRGR